MAKRFRLKKCEIRAFLYISIASLTAVMGDLGGYQSFSQISPIQYAILVLNFILQGFIAWRAFLDQSISETKNAELQKERPSVDLSKISDK